MARRRNMYLSETERSAKVLIFAANKSFLHIQRWYHKPGVTRSNKEAKSPNHLN